MKLSIGIMFLMLSVSQTFGQNTTFDGPAQQSEHSDIVARSNQKLDSIQASFYQKSDSLKITYKNKFSNLDSAQAVIKFKLDSLTSLQTSQKEIPAFNKIDSLKSGIKNKIDSIRILPRYTSQLYQALDSIKSLRESALADLNKKIQSIKDKTVGKLNALDLPPQLNEKLSQVTSGVGGFEIPASDLNISSLNSEGMNALKLDNLNMQSPVENIGKIEGVEKVNGEMGGITEVTGKAGSYAKDVQQVAKGNITEVKELPKTAETKAVEMSGLGEMKGKAQVLNGYKEMGTKMQKPDSFAVQEIKKAAVNHFAGKEEQLKKAMETIAKYKAKYPSINSIADLAKKPPNAMHGKPLIERIIPGIAFQIQKKGDDLLVDFNPYAGYRLTGRITAGLGWNQRVAYNVKRNGFNPDGRIYGPRAFGELKLGKGFLPRAEFEVMNTNVPPLTRVPTVDPANREWVLGAFVGMKKEYRFIKKVKGTASVMVRVLNPQHKSPYADVLNVRFGFEFPMKKKNKK